MNWVEFRFPNQDVTEIGTTQIVRSTNQEGKRANYD